MLKLGVFITRLNVSFKIAGYLRKKHQMLQVGFDDNFPDVLLITDSVHHAGAC